MTLGDMSDRLPDAVSAVLKVLPLPNELNQMVAEMIASMVPELWKDLPLDKSMTVPQTIGALVPMLLGNFSTTLPMSKILPFPLDTSKTLPENVDTMLHAFGLPVDVTKEGVIDVIAELSKALPFDQSHSVSESVVSLLPMLLGINDTDAINHIMKSSIAKLSPIPLDASETLPETVDTLLKMLQLPVNTSESVDTALASLMDVLPLDKTQPMSVMIASMLPILLGANSTDQINQMMTASISKLLPLPLDTNKNLPENVDTILKMLDLPISTDENLPEAIAALINKLPVDKSKTMTETIVSLIPMFLGVNSTDVIDGFLQTSIGSVLPVDVSQSLGDTIGALLPALLPIPNITTASLSKTVEILLGAMDLDADVLATNTISALLKEMLPKMAKDDQVREAVSKILPKNQTEELLKMASKNQTLSQMAKDLSDQLPVNSTMQVVSNTIHQLLPGDTGNVLADMTGAFLGLNETRHIASIINFDPNRPLSELMPSVMGILQNCDKDIFG
jgi:endonuclease III